MRTLKLTVMALALFVAASGVNAAQTVAPPITLVDHGSGVISATKQSGSAISSMSFVALMDAVQTHAQTVVTVEYFPGPAMDSANISAYLTNLLAGTAVKVPALKAEDIIATTSDLSRGYTYYRVVVTNPQGTALRDYILEQDSNDSFNGVLQHSLRLSQDMLNFDYDQWRPGYRADGSIITAGSNTQVVNKFIIIGVCISFTGVTPAAYDNASRYVGMQNPPFAITTTLKVRGTIGDPATLISQPWSMALPIPVRVVLKIQRGGDNTVLVTVTGMNPSMSYTVRFAPTVLGPWSDYKTIVGGADGTGAFTAAKDDLKGFFR